MRKINLLGLPVSLLVVAVLLLAVLPTPMVMADSTPMLCWGDVNLDGAPAPVGTTIDIFIGADTEPSGSGTVTAGGKYGSFPVSADSSRYGEALTYKVNGFVASVDKVIRPCDTVNTPVFGLCNQDVNLEAFAGSLSATWKFSAGGLFPRHLPDSYYGQVVLDNLVDVPAEVQGVYWFDDVVGVWKFWAPGAPGTTLDTLVGGLFADYAVTVTGSCEWDIPLQ
jgi:hypothetical protein